MSPFSPVKTPRWLAILGVAAIPALPVAAWLVGGQVSDNTKITQQIQQSRADATRSSCEEQNERHDNTLDGVDYLTLQRLVGKEAVNGLQPDEIKARLRNTLAALPAAQREQIQQSRKGTAYLINRLAPRRDCEQRVHDLVTIHP